MGKLSRGIFDTHLHVDLLSVGNHNTILVLQLQKRVWFPHELFANIFHIWWIRGRKEQHLGMKMKRELIIKDFHD
jgi:hypothetical protein